MEADVAEYAWRGESRRRSYLTSMEDDWVEVQNCNWMHEASVVVSVLEADGIEVFVPDGYTLSVRPELSAALGGVRIMVRASDVQRAREVLGATLPGLAGSDDVEDVE